MDANFWHKKWENGDIAFHEENANPLLVKYFSIFGLSKSSRIFLPLCGKTRDIAWFLSQDFYVAGAELSELAVKELFNELNISPAISTIGKFKLYSATGIDIFVGDFFELTANLLGNIDAIYDRAALVALPNELRKKYSEHLIDITKSAKQFLICYKYDQQLMDGPPFSISNEEVKQLYENSYSLSLITNEIVNGGLKGKIDAEEAVWTMQARSD